jgi:hypothetical protein
MKELYKSLVSVRFSKPSGHAIPRHYKKWEMIERDARGMRTFDIIQRNAGKRLEPLAVSM